MNKKPAYALLITMFLVVLFGIFSLTIIQNNIFSQNLNKLKYLHLQAKIYMDNIIVYINNSSDDDINSFNLNDDRYEVKINKNIDEHNLTKYYITIQTVDDTPVRLSQSIVK